MIKPRALRSGDRLAVVAPASNCARIEFDGGIQELRRLGYEPVYAESVFARGSLSAGSAAVRARAFLDAWHDPSVSALVAVRGGYGSAELLPLLQSQLSDSPAKLFIGYSDVTSILSWLTCQRGISALHGPMLDRRLARGPDGYDERTFSALAQGGAGLELLPDGLTTLNSGEAAGPLFGGTLTQLTASLGTPFAFDPPDRAVLFIEDVNERPYRIHRMLTQLRFNGCLARAAALVFGEMRGCDEPDGSITALDVIADFARDFAGPVLYGFPSGHTAGPCWTLPLGVGVRVIATSRPSVVIEESAVE